MRTAAVLAVVTTAILPGRPADPIPAAEVVCYEGVSDSEYFTSACSLGCALEWNVSASSLTAGHGVALLDDGLVETAWIAAADDVHPRITFGFPIEAFDGQEQVRFDGFVIVPGEATDPARWARYARPRTIVVHHHGRPIARARLCNQRVDQDIVFADVWLVPGDEIVVEIVEVFPGQAGLPVAITELIPQGAH